jgi:KDO2-lipid IV(A) lauroyltransferase
MSETAIDETQLPERRSNRPVTVLHVIEYGAARALLFFFRLIGVDAASALAGGFLRCVGPLLSLSRRAEDNLKLVFPDWSAEQRRRVIAGVFENLGRTTAEFAHLEKFCPGEPGGRVALEGFDDGLASAREGEATIFVSGHFANWEMMPIALFQSGVDIAIVYRAANNPLIDELIIKRRAAVMGRRQIPKNKRRARALVEALAGGVSLAMLVDQKLNEGMSVPFLGHDAMTTPAAARLALKFGAPIHPVFLERVTGAHFRARLGKKIAFEPTGETEVDVRTLTVLINREIENGVRARPDQWLWLHRRWPKR